MPEKMIIDIGENIYKNYKEVFKVARLFGVSTIALLVRAYSLKLINGTVYYDLKSKAENEFEEYLKREAEKKEKNSLKDKPGGPSYYLLQLNRNGRLFTQTVLDAFRGGFIEPTTASSLLNVRNNKFHKLEAQLY
jgi:Zn-dependent peptidase ImmA (M78 family)